MWPNRMGDPSHFYEKMINCKHSLIPCHWLWVKINNLPSKVIANREAKLSWGKTLIYFWGVLLCFREQATAPDIYCFGMIRTKVMNRLLGILFRLHVFFHLIIMLFEHILQWSAGFPIARTPRWENPVKKSQEGNQQIHLDPRYKHAMLQ